MSASIAAIVNNGCKPVFVDIDEYFHIDVDKIEDAITEKTKVISYVSLYGQTPNINKLKKLGKWCIPSNYVQ